MGFCPFPWNLPARIAVRSTAGTFAKRNHGTGLAKVERVLKKAHLTFFTLSSLALVRALDLLTTFYFNPTLSREGNPVYLTFGGSQQSLLGVTSVFSLLVIIGLLIFSRGTSLGLDRPADTLGSFIRGWLHRVAFDRQPFTAYWSGNSHATEGLQAIRLFGVALAWALIFGSAAAVCAWVILFKYESRAFSAIFLSLSIGRFSLFPSLFAVLGFVFGGWLFFLSDYKTLQKDL